MIAGLIPDSQAPTVTLHAMSALPSDDRAYITLEGQQHQRRT